MFINIASKLPEGPVCTVPTATSVAGFGLVADGVRRSLDTPEGLGETAAGRSFDLIDGYLARMLGQETAFGRAVDPILDIAGLALIGASSWRDSIAPKPFIAGVVGVKTANAYYSGQARKLHPDLAPTPNGKRAMFGYNLAFLSYASGRAIEKEAQQLRNEAFANWQTQPQASMENYQKARRYDRAARVARIGGHVIAGVSLLYYGLRGVKDYRRLARS